MLVSCAMKARRSREIALEGLLATLSANDLRFVCYMFRLNRGGNKDELVQRLSSSEYSAEEVMAPATELMIGILLEEFVRKSLWADILRDHGLASSGPRHELLLRLVENRLFDPKQTLETLNPSQLREIYYGLFDRVPTSGPELAVTEILNAFSLPDFGHEPRDGKEGRTPAPAKVDYDVALSFAGEDRSTARDIGNQLRAQGVRVFMDEYERTELWGRDLSAELRTRYGKQTRFVVVLVSKDYVVKDWTDFEFTTAKDEAGLRTEEFILPVRLDDSPLPGLRSTIAYLTLAQLGVDGIVKEICRKLNLRH